MKKFVILFLLLSFCSSGNEENIEEAEEQIETTTTIGVEMSDKVYDKQPEMNINKDSSYTAVIKTNLGDMTVEFFTDCLLYTSPSPRDKRQSRMPSSA